MTAVLEIVGASLAPLMVMVSVAVVPLSALVMVKVSVMAVLPESRAFTVESVLSMVKVQVPLETA